MMVTALSSLVSIAGLWCLLAWCYRDYAVDSFRQQMFGLRSQLFDHARDGEVGFDSPAYGLLRGMMNSFIRFGHRMSLFQLLIHLAMGSAERMPRQRPFAERWSSALAQLDDAAAHRMQEYLNQVHFLVLRHMFLSSPVLLATVIVPALVIFMAQQFVEHIGRWLRRPYEEMDDIAFAMGG